MCESPVLQYLYGALNSSRIDYYYYATAGGAKIWVRTFSSLSSLIASDTLLIVEEIHYVNPNHPIRDRPLCNLLRIIYPFRIQARPRPPSLWRLLGCRERRVAWLWTPYVVPGALHPVLSQDVQGRFGEKGKWGQWDGEQG